ncbi:MAG: thioredoxin family protein [Anaerolineae bacterium]
MVKPIVDGLERDLGDRVVVIRLDGGSSLGREWAWRARVRAVPTFVLYRPGGEEAYRQVGWLDRERVEEVLREMGGSSAVERNRP